MDIDKFKQEWQRSSIKIDSTTFKASLVRRATSLDRLISSYRRFSILALCCIPGVWSFYSLMQRGLIDKSMWLIGLWIAVMFIGGVVDRYIYNRLKDIDLSAMSVTEVSHIASSCRRLHLLAQLILLPLVLLFLILVAIGAKEEFFRWGLLSGALFGAFLGLCKWLDIMRNYRNLMSSTDTE